MKSEHKLFAAAVLAAALAGPVRGDQIVLTNGSVIHALIVSETDTTVRVNRHGTELALPRASIDRIDRTDLTYFNQEYQQASAASDARRLNRLYAAMRSHPEEVVRERGRQLEAGEVQAAETWQERDLGTIPTAQVQRNYREALDRVRWDDAVLWGRELLRRGERDIAFLSNLRQAFTNTRRSSDALITDVLRLLVHHDTEDMRVAQVYTLSALEDRMLGLWDPNKPDRTDSEVYALLIVRGLLINLDDLLGQDREDREAVESALVDLLVEDDADYSAREIPDRYTLLLFSNASSSSAELVPLFRYFAILKEPEILEADTSDPLLADAVREARGVYIYTVSGITPLPREKLWSSARDLAIIDTVRPPKTSEVISEVFRYTPQRRHPVLAMEYEDMLVPEARRGRDTGEGLRRALQLIASRRSGADFNSERTWQVYEALAAVAKADPDAAAPPAVSTSEALQAMFASTSEFEAEKVCLLYDERLTETALRGADTGDGLYRAIEVIATRRASDLSPSEAKWRAFEALAHMNNLLAGRDGTVRPSASEIMGVAFNVAPENETTRLALMYEERLTEAAHLPQEIGPGLLQALRLIARERARDISDAGRSWDAFSALAAAGMDPTVQAPDTRLEPSTSEIFSSLFREIEQDRHGEVAARFEDNLVNAIITDGERGPGVQRASHALALNQLRNPDSPLSTWRAFELLALLRTGDSSSQNVLALMDEMSGASAELRGNALEVAIVRYDNSGRERDNSFRDFRERWVQSLAADMAAWVNTASSFGSADPPPQPADIVVTEDARLEEAMADVRHHARVLHELDTLENELRARYRARRDNLQEESMDLLVQRLNDLNDRGASPAITRRISTIVGEVFDPATRSALVRRGLNVGSGT